MLTIASANVFSGDLEPDVGMSGHPPEVRSLLASTVSSYATMQPLNLSSSPVVSELSLSILLSSDCHLFEASTAETGFTARVVFLK